MGLLFFTTDLAFMVFGLFLITLSNLLWPVSDTLGQTIKTSKTDTFKQDKKWRLSTYTSEMSSGRVFCGQMSRSDVVEAFGLQEKKCVWRIKVRLSKWEAWQRQHYAVGLLWFISEGTMKKILVLIKWSARWLKMVGLLRTTLTHIRTNI